MKRILFLGAAEFQTPPISYAASQGYHVITLDNRPTNPGHRIANKSYDVSTLNRERVLEISRQEKIDGILSFGSDVSSPTAAFVAEQLYLPGNGVSVVKTLTNKGLFRSFLSERRLQRSDFRVFTQSDRSAISDYAAAAPFPVVIKPTDSSGSKGVTLLQGRDGWEAAVDSAFTASIAKEIIVEPYVTKVGRQLCGDGFFENGRSVFINFGDGHYYEDGICMAPFAETFPSSHDPQILATVHLKLEEILTAIGFRQGPFNFDALVMPDRKPFIVEIGPRSGGNFIPQAIRYASGTDVIAGAVEACLDRNYRLPVTIEREDRYFACYMLHSRRGGILKEIAFSPNVEKYIVDYTPYAKPGDPVSPFLSSNHAVANVVLKFASFEEMNSEIAGFKNSYAIKLR